MAFGTLAFDTLSVSGAISGTAKSVDADYLASGSAKAFYIFDGTAGTPAFADSLNCSSLTDVSTGKYTPAWTNSMGSANYSHTTNSENISALNAASTHVAGSSQLFIINDGGSAQDRAATNGCTHGDLA